MIPNLGFTNVEEEKTLTNLEVKGTIPQWLKGSLIRTTPAKYDFAEGSVKHWFDGLCMLHKFSFDEGKVSYKSKFVESSDYKNSLKENKPTFQGFGTLPNKSAFQKLKGFAFPEKNYLPNPNVNVTRINGEFVAMTEVNPFTRFSVDTLATLGAFETKDKMKALVTTAHPHYDFKRKEFYNLAINFSKTSEYIFYKIPEGVNEKQIVCSIKVEKPAYIHSFGLTENYIILVECPLIVNPLSLIVPTKAFIDNYKWTPDKGTNFYVIDKNTGKYQVLNTKAFFTFHTINAFEEKDTIIFDIATFEDHSLINALYLENLRSNKQLPLPYFNRFELNLKSNKVTSEIFKDFNIELPRINYKNFNTQKYNYCYANGITSERLFFNQVVKLDLAKKEKQVWHEEGCYTGEPVFVSKPNSAIEDEGVLLSLVLDTNKKHSFLLILDALSFEELARINLPHHIPFGFHGQFFAGL